MRSSFVPVVLLGLIGAMTVGPSPAVAAGSDDLASAPTLVSPAPGEVLTESGNNVAATGEPGEQLPTCHPGDGQLNSVWYSWTTPEGGDATFDTFGSDFDTVLAVYQGSTIGALTEVACNDDAGGGAQSEVTFPFTVGETFLVRIDGYDTQVGNYVLNYSYWPDPPLNDDLAGAAPIAGLSGSASGHNYAATGEPGEPVPTCVVGDSQVNSVWYSWTMPTAGNATVDTFGSDFDTVLAIYLGSTFGDLTELDCNDDAAATLQSEVAFHLGVGETVLIQIDGLDAAVGSYQLGWDLVPDRPSNDDFAAAEVLYGVAGERMGWNYAATAETGEPLSSCNPADPDLNSVWFRWTPSWSGPATINTFGSDFDTIVDVWTGSTIGSLTEIACNDDAGPSLQSEVLFSAVAGQTYRVRLDGYGAEEGEGVEPVGLYELHHHVEVPPPPNDDLVNAEVLLGATGSTTGENAGATGEPGEQSPSCIDEDPWFSSVWYEWTAPADGTVTFDTYDSLTLNDTVLAAYTGTTIGALTEIACNDDTPTPPYIEAEITFPAVNGETYLIRLDGFSYEVGDFQLNYELVPDPPPNDHFASAQVLAGVAGENIGWNYAATAEAGEPAASCNPADPQVNSVWFTWTPGWEGFATIDTFGSDFDTVLDVWTGATIGALTELACNDDAAGLQSQVEFWAIPGETYHVRIEGFTTEEGSYELHHHVEVPPPPNDDLVNAEVLLGTAGSTTGENAGATGEPGEQSPSCIDEDPWFSSVWYEWTAPADGTVTFDTYDSLTLNDTVLAAYTGTTIGALTEIACNDDTPTPPYVVESEITFPAVDGETYLIRLDGFSYEVGDFQLNWLFTPTSPSLCNGLPVTVDIGLGQTPTMGDDVILGTPGPDVIDALDGNDTVCGLAGDDDILGGLGLDTIFGDDGDDTIDGGRGNDRIFGGADADDIYGGGGGDRLYGESGGDTIRGGNGNDRIHGGPGADGLRGQNGRDTIYANSRVDHSTTDVDVIYGGGLHDNVFGDAGDDIIYGGNFADVLSGKGGDDTLYGNNGADTLRGGPHLLGDHCNGGVLNSGTGDVATACEFVVNVP